MQEILKHTSQFVYLDVYGGSADALPIAVFTATDGTTRNLNVVQDTAPTGIDDRYHVILNMADTQNDGSVKVTWTFSIETVAVTKVDNFEIVTPYLTIADVMNIWPEATAQQAIDVEAAARHIINAYTGQSFGYSKNETLTVEGHGSNALKLPKRLIKLTAISTLTTDLDPNNSIITSDGWYLKKGWTTGANYHESDSTYWGSDIYSSVEPGQPGYEKPSHGPVIYVPDTGPYPTVWKDDYPFTITGDWGYESVPVAVQDAAKLLVNDFACMEAAYRDRYLESIKAADWRFQFNPDAWSRTGNVRADQLLSDFVILDWAVI